MRTPGPAPLFPPEAPLSPAMLHSRFAQVKPIPRSAIKIEFSDEKTTAFAGLALVERLAGRARLWSARESRLPERGGFDWMTIIEKA